MKMKKVYMQGRMVEAHIHYDREEGRERRSRSSQSHSIIPKFCRSFFLSASALRQLDAAITCDSCDYPRLKPYPQAVRSSRRYVLSRILFA
jgi:hypothetical protein